MSDPKRFHDLPEELKQNIYSHLPMKERMKLRRVSKVWQKETVARVTRLVFIRSGFEQPYGPLINNFHFARHNRVIVSNVIEIESTLRQCFEVNQRLDSVIFVQIGFNLHGNRNIQALQTIGQLIAGTPALEFERCAFAQPEQCESVLAQTTNLVHLSLDFHPSVDGMYVVVQNVLNNNPNIKHLTLRDTLGQYHQFEVPQALESFHVAMRSVNVDENLWLSVRNNSGRTLRVYKSEYFDGIQEKYLAFENLEDLRLANIRQQLSQAIIPSSELFPRLRVLTLRFDQEDPDIEDMTWLFEQHKNLEILDVGVWFRNQNSLKVIADSCPRLQHLSLYVEFGFTNYGVGQLLRLTDLRQLQLFGQPNRIGDDQLMQVVPLPQLRALRANCVPEPMPQTDAAYREKAHADPGRLYFLRFRTNQLQEEPNVLRANNQCRSFFFSWGDMGPFGLYDYHQWQRITGRMLREAFGPGQQQ